MDELQAVRQELAAERQVNNTREQHMQEQVREQEKGCGRATRADARLLSSVGKGARAAAAG